VIDPKYHLTIAFTGSCALVAAVVHLAKWTRWQARL
jgi:hypothetical protein